MGVGRANRTEGTKAVPTGAWSNMEFIMVKELGAIVPISTLQDFP